MLTIATKITQEYLRTVCAHIRKHTPNIWTCLALVDSQDITGYEVNSRQ